MKKYFKKLVLGGGTLAVVIAGAAAFSAFEAHVINVTARIENALSVPTDALEFGTVFPQEYIVREIQVNLSDSFLEAERVDDVTYVIKQKPKVKLFNEATSSNAHLNPAPGDPYATIQVGAPYNFNGVAWRFCEENLPPDSNTTDTIGYTVNLNDLYWQYCYLPLANSLSKHELTTDGSENENDVSVDAFHQAYLWTGGTTTTSSLNPAFLAQGRLVKAAGDSADTWQIDLKVPCFHNHCAQEADDANNTVEDNIPGFYVPQEFRLDPATEHMVFGTDLWIEVTGISLPTTAPEVQTLTVNKVVINDNDGTATTSDFSFMVDGGSAVAFEADGSNVLNASSGPHTVAEAAALGYTASFSGDCDAAGNVNVPAGGNATCTITNNDNPPQAASLTVTKVVTNDDGGTATIANFNLFVNGMAVANGTSTSLSAGSYTVTELGVGGYAAVFSGDCDADGDVTLASGDNKTCVITNDDIAPTVTLIKNVVNDDGGTASAANFTMRVDGVVVPNGTSIVRDANTNISITEDPASGYTSTGITGTGCPATLGELFQMDLAESIICTITNDDNFQEL